MVDVAVKTRQQGLDEQLVQKQADVRIRARHILKKKLLKAIRNAHYGIENNNPLMNKILLINVYHHNSNKCSMV